MISSFTISFGFVGDATKGLTQPRQFESFDELEAWLSSQPFIKPTFSGFDCDDYARIMQMDALNDGYVISVQLIDIKIDGNLRRHMLNSALIGNNIYFIEPRNHKIWFYTYLDLPR